MSAGWFGAEPRGRGTRCALLCTSESFEYLLTIEMGWVVSGLYMHCGTYDLT